MKTHPGFSESPQTEQALSHLKTELERLERTARELEPSTGAFRDMAAEVVDYAAGYLNDLGRRKTWAGSIPEEGFEDFDKPSEAGSELREALQVIRKQVDSLALDAASGGHLAYIPGGGIVPAALGDLLADIANNYAGVYYPSPGAVRIENGLIRWLADLLGYPDSAAGTMLSGGSLATLTAVAAARDNWDPKGNRDRSRAVVYLSEQTHHCVDKSIRMAGMGGARHRHIPLTANYRIDTVALRSMIQEDLNAGFEPWLLVASAGTTDTGAVDPLQELASISKEFGLWYHVDAAYGGGFLLVEELRQNMKGIELSDSVVIDPHKGFFLPYGTGVVIVREGEKLQFSSRYDASYLLEARDVTGQNESEREKWMRTSPADLSPELTRHFRGLRFWLPIKLFGVARFRAALEEKALLCRWFHKAIAEEGFQTGPEPDLSVCIYRYDPEGLSLEESNDFNRQLLQKVLADGRIFLSSTMIDGRFWIRLAVLCFRSHFEHVDLARQLLVQGKDELLQDLEDSGAA